VASVQPTQTEALAELEARVAALAEENAQLRVALESRIVIEQAKGVLMERLDLPADAAFELLRAAARSSRTKIHAVAAEVVATRVTPPALQHPMRTPRRGYSNGRWSRRS
jgi:AmiR/NasT family two-component response regulator